MSVIFGIILAAYILVRCASWVWGQVRLIAYRSALPPAAKALPTPPQLTGPLRGYFAACEQLRCELARQRQAIAELLLSDPDVTFGYVRDARYRRSIIESHAAIASWSRHLEELQQNGNSTALSRAQSMKQLYDLSPLLEPLERHSRQAQHSRALEPFPVPEVRAIVALFEHINQRLRELQQALVASCDMSYRGDYQGISV